MRARGTPAKGVPDTYKAPRDLWDDFYTNSVPVFQRKTVTVEHIDLLPSGVVTAKVLHSLANKLNKLENWQRKHPLVKSEIPYLRHIQNSEGRVTALVQVGNMTLKIALRKNAGATGEDDWIVLGDALKVND